MDTKKTILLATIVFVGFLLVFVTNAFEKQAQDEKMMKIWIGDPEETDKEKAATESENVVVYDQEDIIEIEEKLRELGYIE